MIEMDAVDANTIAAYSAAASALLSLCALGVAIFVPRSAAKLSEELRKQTSAEEEKKRLKLLVFMSIMQERAIPYTAQAVQALNLIDLVFADNQMVKNA
jgi:fructose-specific phosphotransferase system IIC component